MSGIERSVFSERSLSDLEHEVRDVYLADSRPWIVGYSGGKDSTCTLQLIWYALQQLPGDQRTKPLYIISSDTGVETPVIVDLIDKALAAMNAVAKADGLPFTAHKVKPTITDSFWVNLIGRGYPAPSSQFRWCTERLKIRPADRFILDRVAEYGEAVVVLGVRKSESATRDQVMSLHRIPGRRLSRHSSLPSAFVYTPIEDFSVNDVWSYLLQTPSPWGADNRDLLALYKSAQAGECPLVVDKTTPSCGNSRFGCWVCTVVERDKTMEALVDSGEEWLLPLLEFREYLAGTQDPERKSTYRDYRRRDGHVKWKRDNKSLIRGPYYLEVCQKMLRDVLSLQKNTLQNTLAPRMTIITPEELHEIRRIWRTERQDWEDRVPKIYCEVMGTEIDWVQEDAGSFTAKERTLLEQICNRYTLPPNLVVKLLDVERQFAGMSRRSAIFSRLDSVLGEEWRTEHELLFEADRGGSAP